MQRAAALLELDWMFVTAEVPRDRLQEAFQGIRALRFSGVAFLSPHQQAAAQLVDSLTESAIRSGQVRVARRDGDAWLGDDTIGMAIVELLTNDQIYAQADISTQNASPKEKRANGKLGSSSGCLLCTGQEWMPHLIRLARPDWTSKIFQWDSIREEPQSLSVVQSEFAEEGVSALNTLPLSEPVSNGLTAEESDRFGVFVIENSSPPISAKQLARLVQGQDEITAIFVHHNAPWESAIQRLDMPRKRIYRSFDIAAAKATVNFQFWTGQPPEFVSIRDSLEEYCQW